ncbi:MAG: hypothetical protein NTX91_04730 [candidate division SR1 bacterium]|nr:hypothetical protein [candidate division SR1 bacterium]
MNEKNVYTKAELEALGVVKKRNFGTSGTSDMCQLGTTYLLFEAIGPDMFEIHPAYADAFKEATAKELTTNFQQPADKMTLRDLSLEEVA